MTTSLPDTATIKHRAEAIAERIDALVAGQREVTIVAVTKAFPPEIVAPALEAGLLDLGENYAQELQAKVAARSTITLAASDPTPRWHFIGGLQRNKVKVLAGIVSLWQSVDRGVLVDEIAKRSPGDQILIQVNTTGESQKSGCDPSEAGPLVERGRAAGLVVRGLMTVGPTEAGADPRPSFVALRELATACEVEELSMGMSGDYELAVAEGATMVRLGSSLFGPRPPKPGESGAGG